MMYVLYEIKDSKINILDINPDWAEIDIKVKEILKELNTKLIIREPSYIKFDNATEIFIDFVKIKRREYEWVRLFLILSL